MSNAYDHVFQLKKPWNKWVKNPEGKELLEEKKKSNGYKDGKEIEQKNNVKKLRQKVDHSAKILFDDDHLWKYGKIFCEQISWMTRSKNMV